MKKAELRELCLDLGLGATITPRTRAQAYEDMILAWGEKAADQEIRTAPARVRELLVARGVIELSPTPPAAPANGAEQIDLIGAPPAPDGGRAWPDPDDVSASTCYAVLRNVELDICRRCPLFTPCGEDMRLVLAGERGKRPLLDEAGVTAACEEIESLRRALDRGEMGNFLLIGEKYEALRRARLPQGLTLGAVARERLRYSLQQLNELARVYRGLRDLPEEQAEDLGGREAVRESLADLGMARAALTAEYPGGIHEALTRGIPIPDIRKPVATWKRARPEHFRDTRLLRQAIRAAKGKPIDKASDAATTRPAKSADFLKKLADLVFNWARIKTALAQGFAPDEVNDARELVKWLRVEVIPTAEAAITITVGN